MPETTTGQSPIWLERLRNISAEGSPNELMPQKFSPHLQYQKTATISSSGLCCYAPTRGTVVDLCLFLQQGGPIAYQLILDYAPIKYKTQAL